MTSDFSALTFIVSVKSFQKQQDSILSQCRKLDIDPVFVFDYDPEEVETQKKYDLDQSLPIGSRSALLKHIRAQELLLQSSSDCALVLEDDALLFDNFSYSLKKAIDFSLGSPSPTTIFLGGADNKITWPKHISGDGNLIKGSLTTAEAYVIDRKGSELRLEWMKKNEINLAADHFIKHLDQLLGIEQLRCIPPAATQGSITGKFETTLDDNRSSKSAGYLRARYVLRRFLRTSIPIAINKLKTAFRI